VQQRVPDKQISRNDEAIKQTENTQETVNKSKLPPEEKKKITDTLTNNKTALTESNETIKQLTADNTKLESDNTTLTENLKKADTSIKSRDKTLTGFWVGLIAEIIALLIWVWVKYKLYGFQKVADAIKGNKL